MKLVAGRGSVISHRQSTLFRSPAVLLAGLLLSDRGAGRAFCRSRTEVRVEVELRPRGLSPIALFTLHRGLLRRASVGDWAHRDSRSRCGARFGFSRRPPPCAGWGILLGGASDCRSALSVWEGGKRRLGWAWCWWHNGHGIVQRSRAAPFPSNLAIHVRSGRERVFAGEFSAMRQASAVSLTWLFYLLVPRAKTPSAGAGRDHVRCRNPQPFMRRRYVPDDTDSGGGETRLGKPVAQVGGATHPWDRQRVVTTWGQLGLLSYREARGARFPEFQTLGRMLAIQWSKDTDR